MGCWDRHQAPPPPALCPWFTSQTPTAKPVRPRIAARPCQPSRSPAGRKKVRPPEPVLQGREPPPGETGARAASTASVAHWSFLMQPSTLSRAWGLAHTRTHTDRSTGRQHAWAHVPTAAAADPRGLTGLCTPGFSHQGPAAAPTQAQAHLHKEKCPDLAPASGLGEGAVSGQVAALDGQRVVAHPEDGDAQGKDQGAVRAQTQEPCAGKRGLAASRRAVRAADLSLVLGDLGPNAPACTPGSPGQRGPSPGDCHGQRCGRFHEDPSGMARLPLKALRQDRAH